MLITNQSTIYILFQFIKHYNLTKLIYFDIIITYQNYNLPKLRVKYISSNYLLQHIHKLGNTQYFLKL